MHDNARPQGVEALACVQPLLPLQVPVLPQGGAAAHWPAGAAVPAASGVQVPGDDVEAAIQLLEGILKLGLHPQAVTQRRGKLLARHVLEPLTEGSDTLKAKLESGTVHRPS